MSHEAMKRKAAPCAILCGRVEPILALSAILINILVRDSFDADIITEIKTGDYLKVDGEKGIVTMK